MTANEYRNRRRRFPNCQRKAYRGSTGNRPARVACPYPGVDRSLNQADELVSERARTLLKKIF
jgi:hypothetical protein